MVKYVKIAYILVLITVEKTVEKLRISILHNIYSNIASGMFLGYINPMKSKSQEQKEARLYEALISNLNGSLKTTLALVEKGLESREAVIKDSWDVNKQYINVLDKINDTKLDIAKAFIVVLVPGLMALFADSNRECQRIVVMIIALIVLVGSVIWLTLLLREKKGLAERFLKDEADRIKAIMEKGDGQIENAKKLADIVESTVDGLAADLRNVGKK